jgi:two-component system, sporulation sensor kinase E
MVLWIVLPGHLLFIFLGVIVNYSIHHYLGISMVQSTQKKSLTKSQVQALLDSLTVGVILLDSKDEIQFMNQAMHDFLSWEDRDTRRPVFELFHEKDRPILKKIIHDKDAKKDRFLWLALRLVSELDKNKLVLLNAQSVSEVDDLSLKTQLVCIPIFNKRMREILFPAIHRYFSFDVSLDKYRSVFESATVGIAVLNKTGHFLESNMTFSRILGQPKSRVINHHYSEVFPEDKSILENAILTVVDGEQNPVKRQILLDQNHSGGKIVMVTISKIDDLDSVMLVMEDITNLENTHQALLQSEKLSLTGRLAASMAHEINNPLQTSIGCLGLVDEMLDEEQSDIKAFIQLAMEELLRSARIVKRLRDLNRKVSPDERENLDLYQMIQDTLLLTKNRLSDRNIIPILPTECRLPTVSGSKDQIKQVFLNIIMNAIDVMPKGGTIYIDLVPTKTPEGVRIKIRDTGHGMDQEALDMLFEPFHTTKDDGLGLGLFICKRIIEDHNGYIQAESQLGEGSRFNIWLPAKSGLSGKK